MPKQNGQHRTARLPKQSARKCTGCTHYGVNRTRKGYRKQLPSCIRGDSGRREDSILRGFACKPTFHRIGVHQTGLLEPKATASEYGEVRNSLDVVSRGKFREPFCVDLELHGSAREVPRDFGNMRRCHPARAAPGRPEINEHGNSAVANNFVEFLGAHFHGLCHRRYRSTTARGDIWIARAEGQGSWLLSITHAGIAAESELPTIEGIASPGFAIYAFASLQQLYQTLERVYKLGVSLPDAPLESFKKATRLPRTTEAQRLTIQRVGQSLFRDALLEYWNGRCPLTGITDTALLRASHIVPWAECETDELRLDVHNGLLLSALWDAGFDCGLISFAADGFVLRAPKLTAEAAAALALDSAVPLAPLTELHRHNLSRHRTRHGFNQ